MRQDVAFQIHSRCDLDQLQPPRREAEDAPLGDVEDGLAARGGVATAEGDLPHGLDELAGSPLLHDPQPAVLDRDLEPARGEGAGEDHGPGVLADVDEAAGAGELAAETADVDVALGVALGHAEDGEVEAAAVIEVELLVLVDHRVRVDGRAEIETRRRYPADHAGLGGQRDVAEDLLLVGHGGHALRHADTEVDHAVGRQLHRRPPSDDLASVQRHGLQALQRDPELVGEGR